MFFSHIKENLVIDEPLKVGETGDVLFRIGCVFFEGEGGIVITGPGVHAIQKMAFLELCDEKREKEVGRPLTDEEHDDLLLHAVDLIIQRGIVYIRPDIEHMDLAFSADLVLQSKGIPKTKIRFLGVKDEKVRLAIKEKGELWRITPIPQTREQVWNMIAHSKVAISAEEIYYYNMTTGTRYLTYFEFSQLDQYSDKKLEEILIEIKKFSSRKNKLGNPEVAFFMADEIFSCQDFERESFYCLSSRELRATFQKIKEKFASAVRFCFRIDNTNYPEWTNAMLNALTGTEREEIIEERLLGLCPELYRRIQWLPGGEILNGEVEFDDFFEHVSSEEDRCICDSRVKSFISNFIQEYNDIEYVNIGRIIDSLSFRVKMQGRRSVYMALIKLKNCPHDIIRIIRFQKKDTSDFLDDGFPLQSSLENSSLYTKYIFDRYIACTKLGMNLAPFWIGVIKEKYCGKNLEYLNATIESTYFERDYVFGCATDKINPVKYKNEIYLRKLGRLLGHAAATNMIVGRFYQNLVLFDDGDEILIEDADGMPDYLITSDHTGSFTEVERPLDEFIIGYAEPIKHRALYVDNIEVFAKEYIESLKESFLAIQKVVSENYNTYLNIFDETDHMSYGFRNKWLAVIIRLLETDVNLLVDKIYKIGMNKKKEKL